MRKKLFLPFLALLFMTQVLAQGQYILPTPTKYLKTKGVFEFPSLIQVDDSSLPEFSKDILKLWATKELKKNILFTETGKTIEFQRMQNGPKDSYSIDVMEAIRISYTSDAACFYALQSLFQMVDLQQGTVERGFLSDQPKFAWRGMHLDVSRHFYSVDEIKRYLDIMAHYKLNTFHWHLTDDQGWRIEIRKYPKLTEVGSVRAQSLVGHASADPEVYDGKEEKGFYTQNDVREIVAYANKRYITVVPEIEMPGHASAAIAAYPELNCFDSTVKVVEKWGVFEDVFCSKPETIQFLKDVLEEVCQLFPSEYIHIGGDEVPKAHWDKCPKCQDVMKKNELKNTHELQSYFIRQMDEYLTLKGKKLIGWDEILEGGLSPNATVMSWRGTKGGVEAAQQEHFVVMTPTSHCYFDHYQGESSKEPLAIGGYLPLSKVFDFNPIPPGLEPYQETYILGAQANLWTEYIADVQHLDYMIFPRLLALSEVVWSTNKCSYDFFVEKLEKKQFSYLDQRGVNYSLTHRRTKSNVLKLEDQLGIWAEASNPNWNLKISKDGQVLQEERFKIFYPLTASKGIKKEIYILETSDEAGKVIDRDTVRITNQPLLGKQWKINPVASEFYSGNGEISLTDGIVGSRPWNGKEWLGFQESNISFIYDFGEKATHQMIQMDLLESKPSWIYLPKKIICTYYKPNGRVKAVVETEEIQEKMIFLQTKKFSKVEIQVLMDENIPAGKPGEGQKPWFFISEITTLP